MKANKDSYKIFPIGLRVCKKKFLKEYGITEIFR